MKEILDYLSRLRENNNREWFQAHKEEYDRLRPLFVEKIQELIHILLRPWMITMRKVTGRQRLRCRAVLKATGR